MTNVLIVDDQAEARTALRRFIESSDTEIYEASSADEALQYIQQNGNVDVTISDVQMPGRDGLWLAGRLQSERPDIAVIMTSGSKDFDIAARCFQLSVTDWIPKPFEIDHVKNALTHATTVRLARRHSTGLQVRRDSDQREDHWTSNLDVNLWSGIEAMLALWRMQDPQAEAQASRRARFATNIAMAIGIEEPDVTVIEQAALLGEFIAYFDSLNLSPLDYSFKKPQNLRQSIDTLRNVPALTAAIDLVHTCFEFIDADGRTSESPMPARSLGAACIKLGAHFDRLTLRQNAPLAVSEALRMLDAFYRGAEFERVAIAGIKRLAVPQDGPETTQIRWLEASRQRCKEARLGGNPSAIRAAEDAYEELRLEIGEMRRGRNGVKSPQDL